MVIADDALVLRSGATLIQKDVTIFGDRSPNLVIPVLASNDFGSAQVLSFPLTNLRLIGAQIDIVVQGLGGLAGNLDNVDFALGQVATTSTNFTNAGEDNIISSVASTAGGEVKGGGFGSVDAVQGVDPQIFLNVGVSPGVADGTIEVVSGTVTLAYFDVGGTPV